jgi:cytoskeletal protein RodZ
LADRLVAWAPKLALLSSSELDVADHVAPAVDLHFGDTLRRAREQRGLSTRDIAGTTRISVRWIEALEAARLDGLPAEVFVSGYLRSYARAVGLDGQTLLARYHDLQLERGEESTGFDGRRGRGGLARRHAAHQKNMMWLIGLSLVAIIVAVLFAVAWRRGALHF